MPARGLAAVVAMTLGLAACADSSNPFESSLRTQAPPQSASLLIVTSSYAAEPGPRELVALDADGGNFTRLTNCATAATPCDFVQVAPSPDRTRVAAIRTEVGAAPDASALYFMDL